MIKFYDFATESLIKEMEHEMLTLLPPEYHCEKEKILKAAFMKSVKTDWSYMELLDSISCDLSKGISPRYLLDHLYTYLDEEKP